MCGLAAFFEPGRTFPEHLLAGADADLFHRGPDSGGRAAEPGWAMVFRRLAIMDPGHGADQPMNDEQGRCTLVFNGEIYNFRELRAHLEAAGARFRTNGDTEVLLQGYLHWGTGILDRLEGMYAFVLVDRREGVALAARDPFGIKPLYLCESGGVTALASEMRPLCRLIEPRVDEAALAELLTFNWAAGALSNVTGIERVPGGTLLTIPLRGGPVRRTRFLDVLSTLKPDASMPPGKAESEAQSAIEDSVRGHLMSDVGYTLQLSGGIDSSLIAALASEAAGTQISSYAVSLGDHPFDEGEYRKSVVKRYGLDHHEIEIGGHAFADALPRAIRHMEGPVPHGGCVTLMLLCDRLREASKVVLTGEGADEMFGGYLRYANWRKLAMQDLVGKILPVRFLPPVRPFLGLRQFAGFDPAVYASIYHDFPKMHALFPGLVPKPGARETASRRFSDFRDRLFAVDQIGYLESLLVRQDKMSMAASVEARVPFVHMPLARTVNAIPRHIRAPGGVTKPLLKKIAGRFLDSALIHRRKIGLWLPYDEWLSTSDGLGRYLDVLTASDGCLRSYAEKGALDKVVERFRSGDRRDLPSMWTLVNVELWLRSLGKVEAAPPRPALARAS
ncbi:MAG TPA: asparagine synthase (glutamine-hydrolyzing) [Rhizobiales bacterium]|nr:asparagine synthetase [glutamine-hydrolyzing] 1 [bacterium BMS3Bbin10]HDO52599.1 asparagine synthase (glutamine-hydrolyzing) [Hyphomicrobiales bacterium]